MKVTTLRGFKAARALSQETIELYEDRVSPELAEFWRTQGLGTFANGFLKVIDPVSVKAPLERLFEGSEISQDVPVFATVFGDVITYSDPEPNYTQEKYGNGTYYVINFQQRKIAEVGVRLSFLLRDLTGGFFQREMLNPAGYLAALKNKRQPRLHECYVKDDAGAITGVMELNEFIYEVPPGPFLAD